ncbi:MAG TPA: hypothetical protein VHE55_19585 [Fimbriimonadaceae bacterium]|nr:hypothetical protein [Fimbriimonadaceae bacterium]
MNEIDPSQIEIDGLLRESLSTSVPSLSPGFDQRLMAEIDRRAQVMARWRRNVLAGYGIASAAACVVMMRGQGLDWSAVTLSLLVPLALLGLIRLALPAARLEAK